MLRRTLAARHVHAEGAFRWRGHEITRIEGLSDAVFAFAVTLLVVSLEVPHTFRELADTMRGFLAFAVSFTMLFWIWYQQFVFFRRYGLQDATTVCLSGLLLFVVLFYVYPLKFLWSVCASFLMGGHGLFTLPDGRTERMITSGEVPTLMVVYGLGFAAVFIIFWLLYLHAYRRRDELELTPLEAYDTQETAREQLLSAATGLVSVGMALLLPAYALLAVAPYWLLGIVQTVHGSLSRRRRAALAAALAEPLLPG